SSQEYRPRHRLCGMRKAILVVTLIATSLSSGLAQQTVDMRKAKAVIVAFYDEDRLRGRSDGQQTLESFKFFLNPIQAIVKRDFPGTEFRVLTNGKLVRLHDGTGLNVQNLPMMLGFAFSAPGKKRRLLVGAQSEQDFACAAAAYFRRSSPA